MSEQNYLKPAVLLVSGRIVSQVAAIMTFLLCARFLTAELFGAFALASAIVMVLAQLTHVGFHEYILKERLAPKDAGSVWILSLSFGLALGILIILLAHPMAQLFGSTDIERLMVWWSVTPIVSAITSVMTGLAYNEERYAPVVFTTISIEILALMSVAFFLWEGLALDALLIQRLLITTGPALIVWAVLSYPIPFKADREECWRIFHFAKHLSYGHFIGFGSNYGADMALGFVAGPAATGLYRFGARIVIAISTVSNMPLSTLAWTNFSKGQKRRACPWPAHRQFPAGDYLSGGRSPGGLGGDRRSADHTRRTSRMASINRCCSDTRPYRCGSDRPDRDCWTGPGRDGTGALDCDCTLGKRGLRDNSNSHPGAVWRDSRGVVSIGTGSRHHPPVDLFVAETCRHQCLEMASEFGRWRGRLGSHVGGCPFGKLVVSAPAYADLSAGFDAHRCGDLHPAHLFVGAGGSKMVYQPGHYSLSGAGRPFYRPETGNPAGPQSRLNTPSPLS